VTKQDFIFSNKISHRISRHLVFWLVFALVVTIQSFGDPLGGFITRDSLHRAFLSTFFYSPFFIISVYFFTSILFPLLKKKKYLEVVSGFIFLMAVGVWMDYHATVIYLRTASANVLTFEQNILVANNLVWNSIVFGGFALGIKLAKNWYQQKNENLLLTKQKANTELKLLKARIHPDFLFKTLENIYTKINSGSNSSPLLILKLSEILSYQLYESEHEVVPLEKELSAINNFIAISNLTTPGCQITLKIIGDPCNLFITSLLLLSFIHNTFVAINKYKNGNAKTGIVISLGTNTLTLILTLKKVQIDIILSNLNTFVVSEQQRMNLLFPQNNCVTRLAEVKNDVQLSLMISLNRAAKNVTLIKKEVYESA
jgi:hypothetical protein